MSEEFVPYDAQPGEVHHAIEMWEEEDKRLEESGMGYMERQELWESLRDPEVVAGEALVREVMREHNCTAERAYTIIWSLKGVEI